MRWHLFTYTCLNGHRFTAPELPAADYGTLLMRGERTREERVLYALDDPAYAEVDALLADQTAAGGMKPAARAHVLRAVFGVACDPDSEGGRFRIGLAPCCPICGACDMTGWEATEPPVLVDRDVPGITHDEWNVLSASERVARVASAVQQLGNRGAPPV